MNPVTPWPFAGAGHHQLSAGAVRRWHGRRATPDCTGRSGLQQERPQHEPQDDGHTPPAAKHRSNTVHDAHTLRARIFALRNLNTDDVARVWRTVMPWADQ